MPPTQPPSPKNGIAWIYGAGGIQYVFARDPHLDVTTYKPEDHKERVLQVSQLMDSTNPDLSRFRSHGGRLIMLEHMSDYAQSPYAGIRYFESVERKLGKAETAEFARLYTAPGVDHVGSGAPANVDMVDAGRGVEPCELRGLRLAELALDTLEIADAGIGALRIVGHVFEHDQPAAVVTEAAEIGIGRIHQLRHLQHAVLVVFGLVGGDVEMGIAREHILNAAGAIDPGDAVLQRRRLRRRGGAQPPGHPSAGRTESWRVLARDAPARIIVEAVGKRERKFVGRMQRVDRLDLCVRQALIAALAGGAAQRIP